MENAPSVTRCWRYPVKSMQGLEVDRLEVGPAGIVGDRTHGLLGDGGRHLVSAKRTAALLSASATDEAITLPDGTTVGLHDPDVDRVLSAWLGRPVHLARSGTTGPVSYEMTFDPPDDEAEYYEIPAAEASFLDLAPVHLVTTATLEGCAAARPDLDWDVRRFRPNLLVDIDGPPFLEQTWVGRNVRVGEVVLSVDSPTVRCAMPLRAQPGGIARQPELFRAMEQLNPAAPNHLGVYCSVVTPGTVAVGQPVQPG